MKIATFNINNINKRLANLLAWLDKAQPDVVSLQELKSEQQAFPAHAIRRLGYEAVWQGQRAWNGVTILGRNGTPVLTRSMLPGNSDDRQARYIEAAVKWGLDRFHLSAKWESAARPEVHLQIGMV